MLSYWISPRINVDHQALRDPKRFLPSDVKGVVLFPEGLENCFRKVDDFIIKYVQLLLNPFSMIFAKAVSEFYSVEVVAFIPYLLLFIGYDQEVLQVLSQSISLLILSQLPKRFMWRYRPYMVSRARIGSSDRTSSFPARTVGCGIVMTYMGTIVFQNHYSPQGSFNLSIYYSCVTVAFIMAVFITSFCRIILGAHYPSDCFVGTFQGILACFLGNVLHYGLMACKKELLLADAVSNWSWSNIDYRYFLFCSIFGLIFILIMGMKPLQLWKKSPLVAGMLFPSIVFSNFLCPTKLDDSLALTLSKAEPFFHHFIVLGCIFALSIFGYKHFKPRKLSHNVGYFASVYFCFLLLLMLQRLEPSKEKQVENIK